MCYIFYDSTTFCSILKKNGLKIGNLKKIQIKLTAPLMNDYRNNPILNLIPESIRIVSALPLKYK